MKKLLIIITLCITTLSWGQSTVGITQEVYEHYKSSIQGRFSSYPQTLVDSTKSDVLIRTRFITNLDGYDIFYTQQGENIKGKYYPYRQRLYKTKNEGTHIQLEIHTIDVPYTIMEDTPMDTIQSFKINLNLMLDNIAKNNSAKKEGCDIKVIVVSNNNNVLYGTTNNNDCTATFNGSSYTRVQFLIFPHYLISWERGYDVDNNQVWGPTTNPYIFFKIRQD
jgi:hypothetical protein